MAELSKALREFYEAEAREQVSPSRDMTALRGEARAARRRSTMRVGALAVTGALVLGAVVAGGALALKPPVVAPIGPPTPTATADATPMPTVSATPSPTPTASPQTLSITWDPTSAVAEAAAGFVLPQCGETFAPAPTIVDGVGVRVEPGYFGSNPDGTRTQAVSTYIVANDQGRSVLWGDGSFVVTRDGVVVANSLTFDYATVRSDGIGEGGSWGMYGTKTCDGQAALAEVYADAGLDPEAELSDEQMRGIQSELEAVVAEYTNLPEGTYEYYAVSPVIFGPQLAAAEALLKALPENMSGYLPRARLSYALQDRRYSFYCTTDAQAEVICDLPQDVLDEVATFTIDSDSVDNAPSGFAVSTPIELTIPAGWGRAES